MACERVCDAKFPPITNELGELDRVVKCALKMGERERRGNERERRGQQGRMKNDENKVFSVIE